MSSEVHNRNRAKEGGGGVLIARNPMGRPSVYWPPGQPCNWPLEGRGVGDLRIVFTAPSDVYRPLFCCDCPAHGFFFPRPCDNVAPHVRQLYDSGDWTQSVTPDRADGRWASSAFTCSLTCYVWLRIQFKWTEMNLINFKFWFKWIKYFLKKFWNDWTCFKLFKNDLINFNQVNYSNN